MKLIEIYRKLNEDDRELGKPLSTQTWRSTITIYRATVNTVTDFKDRDYVTLSRQFAVDHAENNTIVNDELYVVISAQVKTSDVYDAHNPGEYLYSGPTKRGDVIYTSKGEDFEGWEELEASDFSDGIHDNKVR